VTPSDPLVSKHHGRLPAPAEPSPAFSRGVFCASVVMDPSMPSEEAAEVWYEIARRLPTPETNPRTRDGKHPFPPLSSLGAAVASAIVCQVTNTLGNRGRACPETHRDQTRHKQSNAGQHGRRTAFKGVRAP